MPSQNKNGRNKLDLLGIALFAIGLFMTVFGFVEAPVYGSWKEISPFQVFGHVLSFSGISASPFFIVLGLLTLLSFFLWESYLEKIRQAPLVSIKAIKKIFSPPDQPVVIKSRPVVTNPVRQEAKPVPPPVAPPAEVRLQKTWIPPEITIKPAQRTDNNSGALIDIENIVKTYTNRGSETAALRGVSFRVDPGEFVAIMGPSGSGKSTLMHILGLLDTPTSGSYRLHGKEVGSLSASEQAVLRNKEIGFVFQQFNLLPRTTVLSNVLLPSIYGAEVTKQKALEMIARVGLSERVDHRSNELSGGQIQRVAIARALIMNPRMIIADEPTGNLDSKTSAEILALFKEINREGVTIIMVTHELEVASNAKRIITLRDGSIISDMPLLTNS